jgi:hypothetical protein
MLIERHVGGITKLPVRFAMTPISELADSTEDVAIASVMRITTPRQ